MADNSQVKAAIAFGLALGIGVVGAYGALELIKSATNKGGHKSHKKRHQDTDSESEDDTKSLRSHRNKKRGDSHTRHRGESGKLENTSLASTPFPHSPPPGLAASVDGSHPATAPQVGYYDHMGYFHYYAPNQVPPSDASGVGVAPYDPNRATPLGGHAPHHHHHHHHHQHHFGHHHHHQHHMQHLQAPGMGSQQTSNHPPSSPHGRSESPSMHSNSGERRPGMNRDASGDDLDHQAPTRDPSVRKQLSHQHSSMNSSNVNAAVTNDSFGSRARGMSGIDQTEDSISTLGRKRGLSNRSRGDSTIRATPTNRVSGRDPQLQANASPQSTQELIRLTQAQRDLGSSQRENPQLASAPSNLGRRPHAASVIGSSVGPSSPPAQNRELPSATQMMNQTSEEFFNSLPMEQTISLDRPANGSMTRMSRQDTVFSSATSMSARPADPALSFLDKRRMMNEAKTDLLRHADLFRETCDDAMIIDLASSLKHESFDAQTEICREGDFGDCMYFVANGQVNTHAKDGQLLRKCGEGDFFGEFCLFRGGVRLSTCMAVTNCDLFSLSRDPLMRLVAKNQKLKEGIEREVIRKVIECEYPLSVRTDPQAQREMKMRINEEIAKLQARRDTEIAFQLNKQIGSGAGGEVYSAIDTNTGLPLAVKVVSTKGLTDVMIATIEQEAHLAEQLQHENIIDGYGMSQNDETQELYILMELMPMGSLQKMVKDYGPLPEPTARMYIRHMLQGLAFLHMKGILHRDIKPANSLISAQGVVKLADFGICRHGLQLQTQTITGTPAYMSPEAIEGKYGVASDIWATGCTLLELITGAPPWSHLNTESSTTLIFHIFNAKEGHPLPDIVDAGDQKKEIDAQHEAEDNGEEELPEVHTGISQKMFSILKIMLSINPKDRLDCDTLLQHEWFVADQDELTTVPLPGLLRPDGCTYYGTENFAKSSDALQSHHSVSEKFTK